MTVAISRSTPLESTIFGNGEPSRLGREFTEQASVEVLPVIELTASADKAGLHLDEKLNLSLDTKNATKDQAITWEVKKDEAVYEGLDLSNISEISFIENGEYSFIAKTSDKAGREYESEEVLVRVIEDLDLPSQQTGLMSQMRQMLLSK